MSMNVLLTNFDKMVVEQVFTSNHTTLNILFLVKETRLMSSGGSQVVFSRPEKM